MFVAYDLFFFWCLVFVFLLMHTSSGFVLIIFQYFTEKDQHALGGKIYSQLDLLAVIWLDWCLKKSR